MTAWQPDPERIPAYDELGGSRKPTDDDLLQLAEAGIATKRGARLLARQRAHGYYDEEFGLTGAVKKDEIHHGPGHEEFRSAIGGLAARRLNANVSSGDLTPAHAAALSRLRSK